MPISTGGNGGRAQILPVSRAPVVYAKVSGRGHVIRDRVGRLRLIGARTTTFVQLEPPALPDRKRPRPAPARVWHRIRSVVSRERRKADTSSVVVGGYTITIKGALRFDPRDTYHHVIALNWPRFLLLMFSGYIAINVGFALLYLAQPGSVANMHPGSLSDAFFFSVETSATVGYGEMYPATLYGHCVSTVEIFTGLAFTALATGLLFVRFSRPRARIRYAEKAVIARHQGQPTLMIKIANGRRSLLFDAVAHLNLLLSVRTESGEIVRRVHELRLTRSRLPMFTLAWTLMHTIDETSPLSGCDEARLHQHDARLLLGIDARDVTLAAQVVDTKDYAPSDIVFGMRYADVLSVDADGRTVADLAAVSRMEPDVGPEPPQSGWEDRHWPEAEA